MPKKETLIRKLTQKPTPKNFTTNDLDALMSQCNCAKYSGGRGSAIGYFHEKSKRKLIFDGSHPGNELYRYQIKKVLEFLHEIDEIYGGYVMSRMLEYKGYHASIDYDDEDELFVGSVFGIRDSLNFHGTSVAELKANFHECIDNYLDMCKQFGVAPDKEYKGSFNVRLEPKLHRDVAFAAEQQGITMNQYVVNALSSAVYT